MYAAREGVPAGHPLALFRSRRVLARAVPATVLYLGLISLFTDTTSEMVSAVLPLYPVFVLQLTPLQFGFLKSIHQGAAGVVRLIGGIAEDRTRRHEEVATAGYAMSAVSKLGLLSAGPAFSPFAGALLVDRSGRAIRTAPRDALISLAMPAAVRAGSFAVHRAMDRLGALAGQLVEFALLSLAPGRSGTGRPPSARRTSRGRRSRGRRTSGRSSYGSIDFNFWGASFMPDSNRFYATLGGRAETFLVRDDVSLKGLKVVRSNVECPSVSPDGAALSSGSACPTPGRSR